MTVETDIVLSAIRRGEDSLPKLRAATGLDYAQLHVELHKLEFECRSIQRSETPDGFDRYAPTPSEPVQPLPLGTVHTIAPAALSNPTIAQTARELALLQRNAPCCVGCRGLCVPHGTDRTGKSRWRCRACAVTFAGSGAVKDLNRIAPEKRQAAISAFNDAKSVRAVAAEVGISKQTAEKIRREEQIEAVCPCGKDAKHKGWCAHRFQKSPERQATIEKMNMGRFDPKPQPSNNGHKAPIEPHPAQGPAYKALDLTEVEEVMATTDTVAAGAAKLGMTNMQLYTRRRRDEAVEQAVVRGRHRYYQNAPEIDIDADDPASDQKSEACTAKSVENITETITAQGQVSENRRNVQSCDLLAVGSENGTADPTESAQQERAQEVNVDKTVDTNLSIAENSTINEDAKSGNGRTDSNYSKNIPMAQVQVLGGVKFREDVEVRISEMAQWPAERVSEFFEALATIIEIPVRPFARREIKPAWSPGFEKEVGDPEGGVGLSMFYLMSMLHHDMEPHEKEAVWTLVQYLKRMEAYVEQEKVNRNGKSI